MVTNPGMIHKQGTYRQFWKEIQRTSETLEAAHERLVSAEAYYNREVKDPAEEAEVIRESFAAQKAAFLKVHSEFQDLHRIVAAKWADLATI